MFELVEDWESPEEPDTQLYPEPDPVWNYPEPCDECGGRQKDLGGFGYYNGSYQCYTLTLECENCGPYDVECV